MGTPRDPWVLGLRARLQLSDDELAAQLAAKDEDRAEDSMRPRQWDTPEGTSRRECPQCGRYQVLADEARLDCPNCGFNEARR